MRLRSFYGKTLNEAMTEVRNALGTDAIIVATRDDEAGGIRVTAAIDDSLRQTESALAPEAKVAAQPAKPGLPANDLLDRMANLMHAHKTPAPLAERIVNAVGNFDTEDSLLGLGAAFETIFDFLPFMAEGSRAPVALVGPPGAGKTVAIAKLAARARLNGKSVGLVSADTLKAGGIEQLQAFARILKAPLMAVEDAPALKDAVDAQKKHDIILIDMPGSNTLEAQEMNDLYKLLQAVPCDPVLVLPAGIDVEEGVEIADRFRTLGARRLLATRLDVTRRLGAFLGIAYEANMAFTEASHSARIADGLTSLNPVTLARFFIRDDREKDTKTGNSNAATPAEAKATVRKSKAV